MTRDDVVAALERAERRTDFEARKWPEKTLRDDAALLRALADALRKCEIDEPDDSRAPIRWIIPEPKVKP